jgi:hypothetical protein
MPSDRTRLIWRAKIKRATMSQKFDPHGDVVNTLQLVCEGDMLDPERTIELALLQKESIVTITIEATQLTFNWKPSQKGVTHGQIPDQSAGSGGDPVSDASNDLGIL